VADAALTERPEAVAAKRSEPAAGLAPFALEFTRGSSRRVSSPKARPTDGRPSDAYGGGGSRRGSRRPTRQEGSGASGNLGPRDPTLTRPHKRGGCANAIDSAERQQVLGTPGLCDIFLLKEEILAMVFGYDTPDLRELGDRADERHYGARGARVGDLVGSESGEKFLFESPVTH
jgi:hypothetical protein